MRRLFFHAAVAVAVAITATVATTTRPAAATWHARVVSAGSPSPPAAPKDDKAIVHALNRLAFGPRPGDVTAIREMGLARYIDRQLHPEKIADPAVDARLAGLTTIGMSSS